MIKVFKLVCSSIYLRTLVVIWWIKLPTWSNKVWYWILNTSQFSFTFALWFDSNKSSKRVVHNVLFHTFPHFLHAWGVSRAFEFESSLLAWEKTVEPCTRTHTHAQSPWPPLSETALCLKCRAQGLSQIYNREWRSVGFLSPTELITLIRLLNCMHYNSGFRGEEQASRTEQKVRWHKPSRDMHLLLHINKLVRTAVNIWMDY